eukprot:SAG11_NODE_33595_length_276_cov_0.875706_2_plen_38_part_01
MRRTFPWCVFQCEECQTEGLDGLSSVSKTVAHCVILEN